MLIKLCEKKSISEIGFYCVLIIHHILFLFRAIVQFRLNFISRVKYIFLNLQFLIFIISSDKNKYTTKSENETMCIGKFYTLLYKEFRVVGTYNNCRNFFYFVVLYLLV